MEFKEQSTPSVVDYQVDLGQQRLFVSSAFGGELTLALESQQSYLSLLNPEVAQQIVTLGQRIKDSKFRGTAVITGDQELRAIAALARLVFAEHIQLVGCGLGIHQITDLVSLWRFLEKQSGMPEGQSSINEARSSVIGRYADRKDILTLIRGLQTLPDREQTPLIRSFDKIPLSVVITTTNKEQIYRDFINRTFIDKFLPRREYVLIAT